MHKGLVYMPMHMRTPSKGIVYLIYKYTNHYSIRCGFENETGFLISRTLKLEQV